MKIFVDAHFLDGRKHGAANFLERLYSKYMDLAPAHEIYFGIEPDAPDDYELFKRPGAHVVRYRYGGVRRFFIDIPLLAQHIQPDIVHTQYVLPLRWGYTAKRHVTLFDVLYEDFPELFGRVYRWSRRLVFGWSSRRADLLSTCSQYSCDRIRAVYKPPIGDIHIIHGGVMDESSDTAQVEDQDFADGEFLLYVSRFEKRKNHLSLLNAFVTLLQDKPQLRLVLVGFDADGSQNDCKRFIVTHGIGANVEMLSNISDAHLNRLFRTATVVVYPSLCEGFGMPIIESLLLNPKTVYSNTTAMSDFSFAPENMFNPSDVNAIVQIIDKTMSISADNTTAWVAQREYIANKYNWTRSAQVLLAMHEPQMFAPSLAQRSAK